MSRLQAVVLWRQLATQQYKLARKKLEETDTTRRLKELGVIRAKRSRDIVALDVTFCFLNAHE